MKTLALPRRGESPWPSTPAEQIAMFCCFALVALLAVMVANPAATTHFLGDHLGAIADAVFGVIAGGAR